MSIPQSGGGPIEHYDQLVQYMVDGSKPKADWRIGTEHEKFGYCRDTLKPLPYEGARSIEAVLSALRDRHYWGELREGGKFDWIAEGRRQHLARTRWGAGVVRRAS